MKKHALKNLGLGLVSLGFALSLFATAKSTAYNATTARINRLTETYTHTLEDVPIDIKYDSDKYFISGYSYEAEVYLSSTNRIKLDSEINPDTRNFKVVADLTQLTEGTSEVDLEIKDLSEDITADVRPTTMTVTLGKKVTKSFPIEAVIDEGQIAPGFIFQSSRLDQETVEVTSSESVIEQIDRVVAKLPEDAYLNRSFQDEVSLQALSASGTVLPGIFSPAKVGLTVRMGKLTKTLPLEVTFVGDMDSTVEAINYELGLSEVVVSGSREALEALESIPVQIDVTGIKANTRRTVTLSADYVTITPEVVDVKLTVTKKSAN